MKLAIKNLSLAELVRNVSKANIHATLPARTSILASANPLQGNFDLAQPLLSSLSIA